jgi:acyl carrier protein
MKTFRRNPVPNYYRGRKSSLQTRRLRKIVKTRYSWGSMDEIAERCIAIISKAKTPPLTNVTLDDAFDSLGLDSLDKINVSFEVEDVFHIQIPDESMNSLRTVRDMVNGVTLLIKQSSQEQIVNVPAEEAQ